MRKLNLEPCFQFHLILESIANFLEFKDCAHVSQLNQMYHCKTWKYVLGYYDRKIDQVIRIDHTSINWINTYKLFLTHQHLIMLNNVYDLSIVPKVKCLSIVTPDFTSSCGSNIYKLKTHSMLIVFSKDAPN
jgi:hypothetical protein